MSVQSASTGRSCLLAFTYLGTDDGSTLDDGAPVGTSDPTEGPWETLGEPDGLELPDGSSIDITSGAIGLGVDDAAALLGRDETVGDGLGWPLGSLLGDADGELDGAALG